MPVSEVQHLASLMLRLPRELRDLIYPDIVAQTKPILLSSPKPHPITSPMFSNLTIASESLEAFYAHNTFILDLTTILTPLNPAPWGPHLSICHSNIRHLIVLAKEWPSPPGAFHPRDFEERWCRHLCRQRWEPLLTLSKLASLRIDMQKSNNSHFFWMDFGPILHSLRTIHPSIEITYRVSFDKILEKAWNHPHWSSFGPSPNQERYQQMGYINVSDLVALPSNEDRKYVEEHLSDRAMLVGRSVEAGLLDETPGQRRALGAHYVVKEPALLRVLMEDQYEIYKECNKKREYSDDRHKELCVDVLS